MHVYRNVVVLLVSVLFCASTFAETKVVVRGLMKNMAVLEINGTQRNLRAGKTSPEGVKLISANKKEAVVEIDGKTHRLELSRQIGGVKYDAPKKSEVRIARGVGGHYFAPGRINTLPVDFLVDTGATSVAMSSLAAERLSIDYLAGFPIKVNTANGIAQGYRVMLDSVSVGTVKIKNVEAIVNEGAFPSEILLGNSYLSKVEMNIEDGVLVLKEKF